MTGTVDSLAHLANKVNDHSTVLQAMQIDIQHIVKAVEKLAAVGEKQVDLGHQLERHSESIDRAFRQMDTHKNDLTTAIRELADAFKSDRANSTTVASEVAGFKGSIRALKWAGGIVAALLVFIGGVLLNNVKDGQARTDGAVTDVRADFERRKLAVDIKIDALSQQVQEVRLDRQRDREEKEQKP